VLESGRHLLLEKPMALTVSECDQLVELAETRQRILAVGHELRLSSLWGRVKQLIEEGAIGRVQYVLVELSRFPYRAGSDGWRYDQQRVGSWILEEPIHFFDLARWYLEGSGDPVSVYARANSRDPARPRLADNFSAIVNYADSAYALVSQSLAAFGHYQMAKVVGTEGAIWAEWGASDARSEDPHFALRYGLGDDVTEVELAEEAGELVELGREIDAVADSVRSGNAPPCSGTDGRWSTLLCLAAEQSVGTGQLVMLDK
jgi:myo-inositol 2-dehydrogenase/D-chiro-inositol 1-dehydrogenase